MIKRNIFIRNLDKKIIRLEKRLNIIIIKKIVVVVKQIIQIFFTKIIYWNFSMYIVIWKFFIQY